MKITVTYDPTTRTISSDFDGPDTTTAATIADMLTFINQTAVHEFDNNPLFAAAFGMYLTKGIADAVDDINRIGKDTPA